MHTDALWVLHLVVMVYDCNQLNFHKHKLTANGFCVWVQTPEQTCIRCEWELHSHKFLDACNAYFLIIFACFSCFLAISIVFYWYIDLFKTVPIKHTGLNNWHSFVICTIYFIRVLEGFF